MREIVIDKITEVVKNTFPDASVKLFGSFVTELYLPFSDIDMAVIMDIPAQSHNKNVVVSHLRNLANKLRKANLAHKLILIHKAKVPIIKMVEKTTHCSVDISFNARNGPDNTKIIKEFSTKFPALKPIILIVKYYLYQKSLNEVIHGGMGSYCLIIMVISFYQHFYAHRITDDKPVNLGFPTFEF
jgi:non-canonical poly(A) RNA polymerase PAPD5/7